MWLCQQCQKCKQCQQFQVFIFIARCYLHLWWYFTSRFIDFTPLKFQRWSKLLQQWVPIWKCGEWQPESWRLGRVSINLCYFYPVSKWQWLKKLINWNCVFSDKTSAQGAALRLVLGSVQDLQQGDHQCFSLPQIRRWIFFINDSSSSSSECMGLVYEVATQDVRSDLLFLSFVFCRHSREKYTMKLSDVFNKAFVYTYQSQSWWRSLHF